MGERKKERERVILVRLLETKKRERKILVSLLGIEIERGRERERERERDSGKVIGDRKNKKDSG